MKIDFKKEMKELYTAPVETPKVIHAPALKYLAIDGHGDPNSNPEYQSAVEALYSLSYTIKFRLKKEGLDYVVAPLEGLWWTDQMKDFSIENKSIWNWTMMIMQPAQLSEETFAAVGEELRKKKSIPQLANVRLCSFEDGLAAQVMHLGPYSAEGPTVERLHHFIAENGYELRGKHREIYLSDPNRTAPEKMRTIIRQPIRRN